MDNLDYIWESRVAVDSGTLSIADPCYWNDERLAYENILKNVDETKASPTIELGDLGDCVMAAVFPTVKGDGMYDVYSVWNGDEVVGMFVSFVEYDFMGEIDA